MYLLPPVAAFLSPLACSGKSTTDDDSQRVLAMNPVTGEKKEFSDEDAVPTGWVTCSNGTCPTLPQCEGLDEQACLLRADGGKR